MPWRWWTILIRRKQVKKGKKGGRKGGSGGGAGCGDDGGSVVFLAQLLKLSLLKLQIGGRFSLELPLSSQAQTQTQT